MDFELPYLHLSPPLETGADRDLSLCHLHGNSRGQKQLGSEHHSHDLQQRAGSIRWENQFLVVISNMMYNVVPPR